MSRALRAVLTLVLASLLLAGCVVYQPVPAPGPSNFDRAWSVACIEDPAVIEKILAHLDAKAAAVPAARPPPCRAPPARPLG